MLHRYHIPKEHFNMLNETWGSARRPRHISIDHQTLPEKIAHYSTVLAYARYSPNENKFREQFESIRSNGYNAFNACELKLGYEVLDVQYDRIPFRLYVSPATRDNVESYIQWRCSDTAAYLYGLTLMKTGVIEFCRMMHIEMFHGVAAVQLRSPG